MEQKVYHNEMPRDVEGIAYIYGLVDPRTQELRYVGKTKDAYERFYDHLRIRKNCHLRNWIRQLKSCGLRPRMIIIQEVPDELWPEAEIYWISFFEGIGARLCNQHGGGLGGSYKSISDEHRANLSKALRGKKREPLSEEHRRKLSEALTGRTRDNSWNIGRKYGPRSEETRRRISEAKRGKPINRKGPFPPISKEHREKISASLKGRPSPTKGRRLGPRSQEYRDKLSKILTGKKKPPRTPEHQAKLTAAMRGRKMPPFTEQHRRRLSEAAKRRHQVKKQNDNSGG